MTKIAKIYLALCWAFLIFKLTSFPADKEYGSGLVHFDKLVHLFLFAVFTYLLIVVFRNFFSSKYKYWLTGFGSLLISLGYAMLIEYYQIFIPGRFPSIYDLLFGILGALLAVLAAYFLGRKPSLLLHVCCAGCGVYISQLLKRHYQVTLYFYNPNIYPKSEYTKRLEEIKKLAKKFKLKLIVSQRDHTAWLNKIKGRELDSEKGERCQICYRDRLQAAAAQARKERFDYVATTLTISPHKDALMINTIGKEIEEEYPEFKVKFLDKNFKKQDGFKKSSELSKKLWLYRQNYCGCEFSRTR